jgi:secernin
MRPWSCDTFVALPDATRTGTTILAKNSDRPAGETQPLRYFPRREGRPRQLRLAYLELDDADTSWAHLGASPYWCWGHELGLNEWGLAIGNEALFTRDLAANQAVDRAGGQVPGGILGMELVRLGLQRARTSEEAVTVMSALVETHGQWGSGVGGKPPVEGAYDNSYLVADAREAWVLETSGRRWAARRIRSGTCAISNQPTIRTEFDRASTDVAQYATGAGWWAATDAEAPFDFARAYADPQTPLQASHVRLQRSRQLLAEAVDADGVDLAAARRVLRDHYEGSFIGGPYFNAGLPDLLTLCMHEHPAGFTWGNTASSAVFMLSDAPDRLPYLWWSPVTPCTGLYIPVFLHAGTVPGPLARSGPAGGACRPEQAARDTFDPASYWWRFQQLLDVVKGGEHAWTFAERQPVVRAAFDPLEQRWAAELPEVERQAARLRDGDPGATATLLADFTEGCVEQALRTLTALLAEFGHDPGTPGDPRWTAGSVSGC